VYPFDNPQLFHICGKSGLGKGEANIAQRVGSEEAWRLPE
jgi:hypothetical protein